MTTMSNGLFISIESIDGAGKTTQTKFLADYLTSQGFDVVTTRDPGGTPLAERIRELLLHEDMNVDTETLLFLACRSDLIDKVILPSFKAGKIVISDRFHDSTYVYQGVAKRNIANVDMFSYTLHKPFYPKYTLFLDLDLETSIERITSRDGTKDRFDQLDIEMKKKIDSAYRHRASSEKNRIITIDAKGSIEDVQSKIVEWVNTHFIPRHQYLLKNK